MNFLWKYSIIKFADKWQGPLLVKKREQILFLDWKLWPIMVLFSQDFLRFNNKFLRFIHADIFSSDSFIFSAVHIHTIEWTYEYNTICLPILLLVDTVVDPFSWLAFINHAAWTFLFMSPSAHVDVEVSLSYQPRCETTVSEWMQIFNFARPFFKCLYQF